jgi:hypothetical protein
MAPSRRLYVLSPWGGAIFLEAGMFDYSLCPADDLQQLNDLRRRLIAIRVENLCGLGHARDIKFLFANGYGQPDFDFAGAFGEDAQKIVCEIFNLSHDIAIAEDGLATRERPH